MTKEPRITHKRTGLSGAALKYVAMVSMLIDHTATACAPFSNMPYDWFHNVGRLAFPIFCFLLVEGSVYTSNMGKYIGRVGVFAVISEVPFDMVMGGTYFRWDSCNVMWTLMLGLIVIYFWQSLVEERALLPAADIRIAAALALLCIGALVLLAGYVHTDYGAAGVALIFALYVFRGRPAERNFSTAILLSTLGTYELWGLAAIGFFHAYNGERGRQPRWLIYVFYPAHLLVLGLIRMHFS